MAATTECPGCAAPLPLFGDTCHYCGASTAGEAPAVEAPADEAPDGEAPDGEAPDGEAPAEVADPPPGEPSGELPEGLPAALEARRFRGLAVPLVAAAVVFGIGYPLTALSVSQVGRLPVVSGTEAPSEEVAPDAAVPGAVAPGAVASRGRARLRGAFSYDGPAVPLGCNAGTPRLVTLDAGPDRYSILLSVPPDSGPGTYQVAAATFVAVTRLVDGGQVWTSRGRANATGRVTVGTGRSVSAVFSGLEPNGGGAEGTVEGTVEVDCG